MRALRESAAKQKKSSSRSFPPFLETSWGDADSAVPVLYLDLGFLANLADVAIRFVQIVREFEGSGRPTPAASNSHNLFTGSRLRAGAVPACTCGVPKYQHSDRRRAFGMERLHAAAPGDSIRAVWLSPHMNGGI